MSNDLNAVGSVPRHRYPVEIRGQGLAPEVIAALPALFARSFRTLGLSHYSPEQIEAALASDDGSGYALFGSGNGLVAMMKGRAVGCGALGGGDAGGARAPFAAPQSRNTAILRAFCTDPDFAGRSIGKALMNGLFALAEARGVQEIRLTATLCAAGFYEKCGFTAEQEIEIPCANGILVPAVPMVRRLA
jgi:GNAT superfamily N-acetyltransferase